MKNLLLFFGIALSIFFPICSYPNYAEVTPGFIIAEQGYTPVQNQVANKNLDADDNLADISDDNLNDSERKKLSLGKTTCNSNSFDAEKSSYCYVKRISSAASSIPRRAPLFILISVFRL